MAPRGRGLTRPGWWTAAVRLRVPRPGARSVELVDELGEHPVVQGALGCGARHGQQALGAAEGVGDVEHLGHGHEDRAGLRHHREGHVDPGQRVTLGVADLAVEGVGELALEVGEHRGEVAGERVVGLVRQREQPQLAAQLVVLPLERGVERDVDGEQADLDGRVAGRLRGVLVVDVDHPLRTALVAHLGRGLEPDDLAVRLDRRAPGDRALRDHGESAPEGQQQVEVVADERGGWHRRAGRAVDDLDARVAGGAAHAHLEGRIARGGWRWPRARRRRARRTRRGPVALEPRR